MFSDLNVMDVHHRMAKMRPTSLSFGARRESDQRTYIGTNG